MQTVQMVLMEQQVLKVLKEIKVPLVHKVLLVQTVLMVLMVVAAAVEIIIMLRMIIMTMVLVVVRQRAARTTVVVIVRIIGVRSCGKRGRPHLHRCHQRRRRIGTPSRPHTRG